MLAQKIKLPHCNLYWLVYLAKCEVEVGSLPQLIYYNTGQICQSVYSSSAGRSALSYIIADWWTATICRHRNQLIHTPTSVSHNNCPCCSLGCSSDSGNFLGLQIGSWHQPCVSSEGWSSILSTWSIRSYLLEQSSASRWHYFALFF